MDVTVNVTAQTDAGPLNASAVIHVQDAVASSFVSGVHGGGGFNLVVPDPSTPGRWFLTTDVGGPSISDDNGTTWRPIKAGLVARRESGFSGLWIDPQNSNHLLALAGAQDTGDQGTGAIYETTNAGTNWNRKSNAVSGAANGNIASEANGPRSVGSLIIKLGTTYYVGSFWPQGVYKSTNLTSWTVHSLSGAYIRCLVADPSDPNAMLVACANHTATPVTWGVYRVKADGTNTQISSGLPVNTTAEEIVICPVCNRWYVTMSTQGVYVSTNNGASWSKAGTLPNTSKWAPICVQHNASSNQDELLTACHQPASIGGGKFGSIYRSVNGGSTWTPCVSNVNVVMKGTSEIWWESIDNFGAGKVMGAQGSAVHCIAWDPNNPNRAMLASQGAPWVTEDKGDSWQVAPFHATITKHSTGGVDPKNVDRIAIMSDDWACFYSANGLETIDQIKPNGIADAFFFCFGYDGVLYITAGRSPSNKIMSSANPADTGWTDLQDPATQDPRSLVVGTDAAGKAVVLAGAPDGLWRRFWNGSAFTWEKASTDSYIQFAWPEPRNGPVVFGATTAGVFKSFDYGHTWSPFWTSNVGSVNALECDKQGHLYLSNAAAVTRIGGGTATGNANTTDTSKTVDNGGVNQTNLGRKFQTICVDFDSPDVYGISSAVSGSGITTMKTTNFGGVWTDITTDDMRAGLVAVLWMHVQSGRLYVTTDGQGAYIYNV